MELLKNNHDALEIITQIAAIIVAIVAAATYWSQKRDRLRTAATLIINQIDDIEQTVDLIKQKENKVNEVLYKMPCFMSENYWDKYKVLFIKYLKNSDIEMIDKFYENANQIQSGRDVIVSAMTNSWKWRSLGENLALKEFIKEENMKAYWEFLSQYEGVEHIFRADVGPNILEEGLSKYVSIKGSVAYSIIQKKSYRK